LNTYTPTGVVGVGQGRVNLACFPTATRSLPATTAVASNYIHG
jgi:hypothetical protein